MRLQEVTAVDGHKYRVRAQSARGNAGKNQLPVETKVKPKLKDLVGPRLAPFNGLSRRRRDLRRGGLALRSKGGIAAAVTAA